MNKLRNEDSNGEFFYLYGTNVKSFNDFIVNAICEETDAY